MNREIPDEWFTPDLQDRPRSPHEGGKYPRTLEPETQTGKWWPELLQAFIDHQRVDYESAHGYANARARSFVSEHLDEDVNPDELLITTLYIDSLDSEPQRANVGYSMTLTDALMRNWQQNGNGQYFDHLSVLREYREGGYHARISATPLPLADCFAYEAIYRRTRPQRFDRSTHVAIDPKAFKQFAWDADLQAHYLESLAAFWSAHGANYHLLIKAAVLKSAYVQYQEHSLTAEDKALVLGALGLSVDQDWESLTFERFCLAQTPASYRIRELILYRYVATDIILMEDVRTDRLVMYIPGNSSPLHGFSNLSALCDWIVEQCRDPQRRRSLESHFRAEDDPDGYFLSGIQTTLAGFAAYPNRLDDATGHWWPHKEVSLGAAISGSPFTHFKRSLQDRLESDARQLIHTRADYNREQASQILTNAIIATGAIAMVVPALWVPLAAMSLALTGLGAYEFVNGRSEEEKKEGVGRIVFGLLNAVPLFVERTAAARELWGAAARAGDGVAPGAADEVGQMVATRSAEQREAALEEQRAVSEDVADEARERASELPDERQWRQDQEEQQRLAGKSRREATPVSSAAFGIEPEGLRALTPALRAELSRFEYNAPLDRLGHWGVDGFGAVYTVNEAGTGNVSYFARVHSKIYCVERVEAAMQYRIFLPDEVSIKGPYLKRLKGYYSDLDLKTGLRGGNSFIEVTPEAGVTPDGMKPAIVTPRPQPPVIIDIPMDGIEVRPGVDANHQPADQYFAMDTAQGTPVRYDADLACWRKNTIELMWRNNKGLWKSGDVKAYMKVRSRLTFGISSETYRFPPLPSLPANPEAVDLTVHQIWLGDRLPSARLIETMKENMRTNPDLKFMLHIDIDSNEVLDELMPKAQLQTVFKDCPNLTVSDLQDEAFFSDFLYDERTAEPFYYFRKGEGQNLAAASDVLRYRLIYESGGIYMDCDDVIRTSFKAAELKAGPSDVLTGGPVLSRRSAFFGPNNSHFASHPGNPVLGELQAELFTRFQAERQTLDSLKGAATETTTGLNPYVSKIFEVTGPRLFLDVLKKVRPDYADLLDEKLKPKAGVRSFIFLEFMNRATDFYAPFARRLRITAGVENSWMGHS